MNLAKQSVVAIFGREHRLWFLTAIDGIDMTAILFGGFDLGRRVDVRRRAILLQIKMFEIGVGTVIQDLARIESGDLLALGMEALDTRLFLDLPLKLLDAV